MQRPANCVVVQPIIVQTEGAPLVAAAPPERTLPASEVVGLAIDFKGIWQEHVTPGSPLEKAGHAAGHRPDEAALRAAAYIFVYVEPAGSRLTVALFHPWE